MGTPGNVEINFNDTSEYMFRNSSTQKGGFEGNFGTKTTDVEIDIDGTEDVNRTGEQLTEADRTQLRAAIALMEASTVTAFATDKADLSTKAQVAWDRAVALYPAYRAQMQIELDDIRTEMLNTILLQTSQWARIAGSSLNCLVAEMRLKAETELARRLTGIVADRLMRFNEIESQAIAQAFDMNMNSRGQMQNMGLSNLNALWGILRGAHTTEVTDRDYTENRDEDNTTFDLLGRFYHEGVDISDNDGSYNTASAAVSASELASALIPGM